MPRLWPLASLALLAHSSSATAQIFQTNEGGIDGSTTRGEALRKASETNSRIFGAIGAFNRFVLPKLANPWKPGHEGDDDYTEGIGLGIEYGYFLNAAQVTGSCNDLLDDRCNGTVVHEVDLTASNFALVYPLHEYFGFFYTASYTQALVPTKGVNRGVFSYVVLMGPLMAYAMTPFKVFGVDFVEEFTAPVDAVIGGYIHAGPIQGYGGYILSSQGVFGDINIPAAALFTQAALANEFKDLSYLAGGLKNLPWQSLSDDFESVGATSLYGRQVEWVAPTSKVIGEDELRRRGIDLVTAHLGQTDIGGYVDLLGAYQIKPTPSFFEGRVGIHTENFTSQSQGFAEERAEIGDDGLDVDDIGFGVTVGLVELPDLYYYGVEGGRRFMFSAEAGIPGMATVLLRFNDPDVLAEIPIVYDSLNLVVRFQI